MTVERLPGEVAPKRKPKGSAQTTLHVVARVGQDRIARVILQELAGWGRIGTSSKVVARATRIPQRTVKFHLRRLLDIGEVLCPTRGYYSCAAIYHDLTADPLAKQGFQNLRFAVPKLPEQPPPPCRIARSWTRVDGGDAGQFEKCELAWEARRVLVRFYPSASKYEVIVAAQEPIPLERAGRLYDWLCAQLDIKETDPVEVTAIEVNSDHGTIRMEPMYVDFHRIPHDSHVIYQKRRVLREEYRLRKPTEEDGKPLTLGRAVELLVEGSPMARYERVLRLELQVAQKGQESVARALPNAREAGYG